MIKELTFLKTRKKRSIIHCMYE